MSELFEGKKVVVCIGSGGVGKTTVAAALGVLAAQQGLRVLVLTIDPSKRLASTLGIADNGDVSRVPGSEKFGALSASVVNHRQTFDDFVRRAAEHAPRAEKILNNRLYQQLTTSLSGSQDFTALEKLLTCSSSGDFDLVILDTPPAQHAIEFLNAPEKIARLFNEGIAKWFRDPEGRNAGLWESVVKIGTRQVFKVLETLTGSEFLKELSEFFKHLEGWQDRLEKRTAEVQRLLASPSTAFVLVTGFDQAKLLEAEDIAREIRQSGYHLDHVVLNRAFPEWLDPSKDAAGLDPRLQSLYSAFLRYYEDRRKSFDQFRHHLQDEAKILQLPEMGEPISDLEGLETIARRIGTQGV